MCLFVPSVTVCVVVCVRLMTCSSYADETLWWFSTSTHVWERVDSTSDNGVRPIRYNHVMTSVGVNLWVHGGSTYSGEGDTYATHVSLLMFLQ